MAGSGGRRGGRSARRMERAEHAPMIAPLVPRAYVTRNIPFYELLDEEGVETLHDASMTILEEIGIDFRDEEALALWREAGAHVTGQRVRISRELAMAKLALAPREFVQHARNPERSVVIGGRNAVFAPTYGSPFVRDFDGTRRYATLDDLVNFIKLTHMTPALHHGGGVICEPVNVAVPVRHLDMVYSLIKYCDKPFMGMTTAPERAEDTIALAKIVFGDDFVDNNTVLVSVVNGNSPLVWDETMLGALKVYARHNQAALVTPFIMAGASSPVSAAGSIAQLNAEAVAGIAFAQLVRPGAPMLYGASGGTASLKTGAPMGGGANSALISHAAGQLARRYGLPLRTSGMMTTSKIADAQAAYESEHSMLHGLLAGANFVLHAAGWLEAGLTAGYGKFILDSDRIASLATFTEGIDLSPEALALDAVREVGPAGHFFGCAHTRKHYLSAFYHSPVADCATFEQWCDEGARDAETRAVELARRMLAGYQPPPLDADIDAALRDFIARRKSELAGER